MTHLRVTHVGPLTELTLPCASHLNVIVGPNSSGQSTSLMALANLVAYPLAFPERLRRAAAASGTVQCLGRDGQQHTLRATLPVEHADPAQHPRSAPLLAALGYSAFVPALRQSTPERRSHAAQMAPGLSIDALLQQFFGVQTLGPA